MATAKHPTTKQPIPIDGENFGDDDISYKGWIKGDDIVTGKGTMYGHETLAARLVEDPTNYGDPNEPLTLQDKLSEGTAGDDYVQIFDKNNNIIKSISSDDESVIINNIGSTIDLSVESGGVTTLLALTDVLETTYIGNENKLLKVNSSGIGAVFSTLEVADDGTINPDGETTTFGGDLDTQGNPIHLGGGDIDEVDTITTTGDITQKGVTLDNTYIKAVGETRYITTTGGATLGDTITTTKAQGEALIYDTMLSLNESRTNNSINGNGVAIDFGLANNTNIAEVRSRIIASNEYYSLGSALRFYAAANSGTMSEILKLDGESKVASFFGNIDISGNLSVTGSGSFGGDISQKGVTLDNTYKKIIGNMHNNSTQSYTSSGDNYLDGSTLYSTNNITTGNDATGDYIEISVAGDYLIDWSMGNAYYPTKTSGGEFSVKKDGLSTQFANSIFNATHTNTYFYPSNSEIVSLVVGDKLRFVTNLNSTGEDIRIGYVNINIEKVS